MKSALRISSIISEVCEKEGIAFESKNPAYQELKGDEKELENIYTELKTIIRKLEDIESRHNLAGLTDALEHAIKELTKIDLEILVMEKMLSQEKE